MSPGKSCVGVGEECEANLHRFLSTLTLHDHTVRKLKRKFRNFSRAGELLVSKNNLECGSNRSLRVNFNIGFMRFYDI
jgi:hypothetical protein